MKNVKKVIGIMSCLLLLSSMMFVGCQKGGNDETGGSGDNGGSGNTGDNGVKTTYALAFVEDVTALAVNIDETITITVDSAKTTGTWKLDEDNVPDSIVVTPAETEGKLASLTIKGVKEASSVSFVLYPEEAEDGDTSMDVTVKVEVVNPNVTFDITLSDELAAVANEITVTYSNDNGKKNNFPADVEYSAGSKTVKVTVSKEKAKDNWNWLNAIIPTVKDADGKEILVVKKDGKNNFDVTADYEGFSIDILELAEMTVKISFTDFEADSVKVTYGCNYKTSGEVDAVISADGTYATFTAKNDYMNFDGYLNIQSISFVKGEAELNIITEDDLWFEFEKDSTKEYSYETNKEMTVIYTGAYTADGDTNQIITKEELEAISINVLKVSFANAACDGEGWWIDLYAGTDWSGKVAMSWDDSIKGYSVSLSTAEAIAAFTNGIYIAGMNGLSGTLTVSYR